MIKKEDIKVGLEFYITRKDCQKCGKDVTYVIESLPVLLKIDGIDGIDGHKRIRCTLANLSDDFSVCFDIEDIMTYGILRSSTHKTDDGKSGNGKSEQVNHPYHYEWLKDLCGVEPIEICRHFDFSIGNALKYLMRKGKADGDKTEEEKRIEDLRKAIFYINDEIKRIGGTRF